MPVEEGINLEDLLVEPTPVVPIAPTPTPVNVIYPTSTPYRTATPYP